MLDDRAWSHVTRSFRALDHEFGVRCDDVSMGEHLEAVLDPMAVPGRPDHLYSVIVAPGGEHELYFDEWLVHRGESAGDAVAMLLWHVNNEVCFRGTSHLLVHAAAAESNGQAIVLPAHQESGKSTLVAGLVAAGLRYLTDEAAALRPGAGVVDPYPRAISLDPGSWPLLPDLRPVVPPSREQFLSRQWHVDPRTIHADAFAPSSPPGWVIAPRYREGAESRLEPLSAADAVVLLAQTAFNLRHFGQSGLELLADVAKRCERYRLTVGDLDSAVRLVLEVVDGP